MSVPEEVTENVGEEPPASKAFDLDKQKGRGACRDVLEVWCGVCGWSACCQSFVSGQGCSEGDSLSVCIALVKDEKLFL